MRKLLILTLLFLASCSLNKVVQHHGVHNLEKKQTKLKVNFTNKNDIIKIIGNKAYGNVPSRNRKIEGMVNIEMINDLKDQDIYLYNEGKFLKINKGKKIDYNILSKELKCSI